MSRFPGRDNYRVVVRNYYDYEIFVQATDPCDAREIAEKTHGKDHKILTVEKYNYWEV